MNENHILLNSMRQETCPACAHHIAIPFLDPTLQPLATIAWPRSAGEATSMRRLPLDFVRCVECGHVYNSGFDYANVPYAGKPNLMFNKGLIWSGSIDRVRRNILSRLPEHPRVVEIGHGDGSFLTGIAEECPDGRFAGFDPHGAKQSRMRSVRFYGALFEAKRHMPEFRPDLVVSRHVLEHLNNPLGFVQALSFSAACLDLETELYIEVPCIDQAVETGRTVDFYYEHNSQFTTLSFEKMLGRCGVDVREIGHIYSGEVVYAFVRLGRCREHVDTAEASFAFRSQSRESEETIIRQLAELHQSGKKIAIWGGTGKSAAFINRYGADAARFPLVVDSDPEKVGTFVPGTGQEIRLSDWLAEHPADVIIIPPQWRAKDILGEMGQKGIRAETILIEHGGRLTDYLKEEHPYKSE